MQTNQPSRSASDELRLTPQNPWPGLPAFTAANSQFFFGREAEIAEIFRRVRRQMLTVLFGVSGLGKTSLLQAGLLPRLGGTPFHPILIRLDHAPEAEDLIEQVRSTIARAVAAAAGNPNLKIPRAPEKDEDLWGYFHNKALDWFDAKGEPVYPVLVFDQFEEIFTRETRTRATEERKQRFIEALACLVENRPPDPLARDLEANPELSRRFDFRQDDYRVVISLREDFLAHLEGLKRRMPSVMENRMRLTRMDREQALQAVIGPGREIVDEPVAREIVAFVAGKARDGHSTASANGDDESVALSGVEPALLSLVCDELNRRRLERKQERITADLLTEEREGIIQAFYERAFEGVDNRVREWVEDELLTASGYRDRAAMEDALRLGLPASALDQLVDRRILHREEREGVVWLELTHDLLTGPAERSRTLREQRLQAEAATAREQELRGERDRQRRRARRSRVVSGALGVLLLYGGARVWLYWDSHIRLHTRHFNAFGKVNGIPVGVGRLSDEQVKHRSVSFRFIYRGRPEPVSIPLLYHGRAGVLLKVQAVNSRGALTTRHGVGTYLKYASEDANANRECQWEFIRNSDNIVVNEMGLDRDNKLVWAFVYSPATEKQNMRLAQFVGPNGLPQAQRKSSAEYVEFTYDDRGNEIKVRYLDHFGRPQPGPDGAYGEERQFARGSGLPTRRKSLDSRGQPMVDHAGNAGLNIEYDSLGNSILLSAFDASTNNTTVNDGWHTLSIRCDPSGNWLERQYFGLDGKPVMTKHGYARETTTYDEHGNAIEWACFDTSNQPTLDDAEAKHKATEAYDERGNRTNWVCYGTDGKPAFANISCARISWRYDDQDNVIETAYFDTNDRPVITRGGYARTTMRYDEQGHKVEQSYFDISGKLISNSDGYARVTMRYDKQGNRIEESYFDDSGGAALVESGALAYTRMTMTYDERGNRIEEYRYNQSEKPDSSSYTRMTMRYDDAGNLIEQACFSETNSPVLFENGYAKLVMRYDEKGNQIARSCFGANDLPVVDTSNGTHGWRAQYDERRNWTNSVYLNTKGQPANCRNGYARETAKYDARRNQIEWAYFDVERRPATNKSNGSHLWKKTYDEHGRWTNWVYFSANGQPVMTPDGYARLAVRYDARGNETELLFFDTAGRQVSCKSGYARRNRRYDEMNRLVEISYGDESGNLTVGPDAYARYAVTYDERGHLIGQSYLDRSGTNLTMGPHGYAKYEAQFDENGNPIERKWFDATGRLHFARGFARETIRYDSQGRKVEASYFYDADSATRGQKGYALVTTRYDEKGRRVSWACFDEDGAPAADISLGNHKSVRTYDDRGNVTGESYFDQANKPVRIKNGYAKYTIRYDSKGNRIEQAYFNETDELYGGTSYARETATYDSDGRKTEVSYYYEPTNPIRRERGYAEVRVRFDSQGRRIEWRCFDDEKRPVMDLTAGNHFTKTSYDEAGNLTEVASYDTSEKPIRTKDGYARQTMRYDERGNRIETAYFDQAGNPVRGPTGCALISARFDDSGNQVAESYLDTDGQPMRGQVIIVEVLAGGKGEQLGLQPNDVILAYGGKNISFQAEFVRAVTVPGTDLRDLEILRAATVKSFKVKSGLLGVRLGTKCEPLPPGAAQPLRSVSRD